MSTVRVFGTLADVVGQPLDRARVTVALVAPSGLPVDLPETETTVVSPLAQTVESAFSFDLVPQSECDPADSWYTLKVGVPNIGVTVTRAFTVPADVTEVWVGELWIDPPTSGGGTGSGGPTTLTGLVDVDLASPSDGQILVFDSATGQWRNEAAAAGGAADLEGLSDVDLTSPGDNEVLTYDGSQWVNEALPAGVTDLEGLSDVDLTSPAASQALLYDGSQWRNQALPSSLPARAQATKTTASLAANASEAGTVTMAKSYRLLKLTTNRPARVRLYTTAAKRDADAARPIGTDPTGDHGLQFEFVSTASLLVADCAPLVDGTNLEASPSTAIPIAVQNRDTGAGAVTVTLDYLPQE